MVNIQHHALSAFEQNATACADLFVEQFPDRLGIGQDLVSDLEQFCFQLGAVWFWQADTDAQRLVVGQKALDLHVEGGGVCKVCDADGAAADAVFIGRADAALRGADLASAERAFAGGVDVLVPRENERGIVSEHERLRRDFDALGLNALYFFQHVPWIDHDAIADHRELAAAHEAGGQQGQLEHLAVNDQRVASIVPALKADDHIGAAGQPVDDLALAFVAPLGPDNHYSGHDSCSCKVRGDMGRIWPPIARGGNEIPLSQAGADAPLSGHAACAPAIHLHVEGPQPDSSHVASSEALRSPGRAVDSAPSSGDSRNALCACPVMGLGSPLALRRWRERARRLAALSGDFRTRRIARMRASSLAVGTGPCGP